MRIGCVLMAAGNAARFGKNKLLAEYQGKPLIRYALDAADAAGFSGVAVVTQYDEVAALAGAYGFEVVRNERPELGVSRTVRLGTEALMDRCDAIAYLVADQPLLQGQTVLRLCAAYCARPDSIVVPFAEGKRGNPCIFPAKYFAELCRLEGDRGGSQVIRQHPERILRIEVAPEELLDVDTAESLEQIKEAASSL